LRDYAFSAPCLTYDRITGIRRISVVLSSCLSCLLSYIAVVLSSLLSPPSLFLLLLSFSLSFYNAYDILNFSFIGRFRFIQRPSSSCEICVSPFQSYDQMAVIASLLILPSRTCIGKVRVSRHDYSG